MVTFEEAIEQLEMAIEEAMPARDSAKSYRAQLIFDRLEGVGTAIDDWRQGGPTGGHGS